MVVVARAAMLDVAPAVGVGRDGGAAPTAIEGVLVVLGAVACVVVAAVEGGTRNGGNGLMSPASAWRTTRQLTRLRPLEVLLAWIFRRHTNRIKFEIVIIRLSEPQDRFVATGKAPSAVKPVLEMPDDAVPQFEPMLMEDRIKPDIEREYFSAIDVVSDLPTQ